MDTLFTKGAIIELEDNTEVAVLDSYAIDAKNIRIIVLTERLDICILNFNLDTDELSCEHCYDTIRIVATLKQYK